MKFNILLTLSALLATAAAQGLNDLPDCSKECATAAIPQSCGVDFKCICEAKSFLSDVSCCVAQKCSKADQETTIKVARGLCAKGGVTDLPTAAVCSTGASSSSSSSSSSSTETGTTTGTSTGTNASAATKTDSTTATGTQASITDSSSSSAKASSAAATSTGVAGINHKDSSLVAAAGVAAAFAVLI